MGGPPDAPDPAAPAIPVARRTIGLASTGVFLASLFIQGVGFIASFFLYHNVATSALGIVQLYLIAAASINGIADLRIGSAFVFFVSRGQPPEQSTGTYLVLRLLFVGGAGAGLFLLAPIAGTGFTFATTPAQLEILAIFLALPLLWSVQMVYTQLWTAKGDALRGQYPLLLESTVRTPALVLGALFLSRPGDPTLLGLTAAYLAGAVASSAFALPTVLRHASGGVRWAEARRLFRYAWPLMGSLLLSYLAGNVPPFLVTFYLGAVNLPYYLAPNGWRILALSLPAAVAVPLFPHLSGLHRKRAYEAVRDGTWRALRYTAMVVVPGVVAMIVYRSNLLNIFAGERYAVLGGLPLAILAVSVLPAALSQIIGTSLNAIGQQRLELYLTSMQVIVLFATAILLFRPFDLFGYASASIGHGLTAAAVAVLVASSAALAVNTFFLARLLAVRIQLRPVGMMLVSALASFFAVSRLNEVLPVNRYYQLAAGVLLGFGVYFLVLAALGEMTREDVRYLAGSIGLPPALGGLLARVCWREASRPLNAAAPGTARGLADRDLGDVEAGRPPRPPP